MELIYWNVYLHNDTICSFANVSQVCVPRSHFKNLSSNNVRVGCRIAAVCFSHFFLSIVINALIYADYYYFLLFLVLGSVVVVVVMMVFEVAVIILIFSVFYLFVLKNLFCCWFCLLFFVLLLLYIDNNMYDSWKTTTHWLDWV